MSRLSQSMAYITRKPNNLTKDWIKSNLTDIEITDKLKDLRKEYISNSKKTVSLSNPIPHIGQ